MNGRLLIKLHEEGLKMKIITYTCNICDRKNIERCNSDGITFTRNVHTKIQILASVTCGDICFNCFVNAITQLSNNLKREQEKRLKNDRDKKRAS